MQQVNKEWQRDSAKALTSNKMKTPYYNE